jgi:uncharacterized membrane protein YqgA involved in biofilm formation
MNQWQITLALVLGGAMVGLLYNIGSKIDAISRLLHEREHRRRFPEEYSN